MVKLCALFQTKVSAYGHKVNFLKFQKCKIVFSRGAIAEETGDLGVNFRAIVAKKLLPFLRNKQYRRKWRLRNVSQTQLLQIHFIVNNENNAYTIRL